MDGISSTFDNYSFMLFDKLTNLPVFDWVDEEWFQAPEGEDTSALNQGATESSGDDSETDAAYLPQTDWATLLDQLPQDDTFS